MAASHGIRRRNRPRYRLTKSLRRACTPLTMTGMTSNLPPLLILVHPGSACGSADFTLGRDNARDARMDLSEKLGDWSGNLLVVDGSLSTELATWPMFGGQIKQALAAAKSSGFFSGRIFACDDETENWPEVVAAALKQAGLPSETPVEVTGAWFFEDDTAGCVNAARDAATAAGFTRVHVDRSAVRDPLGLVPSLGMSI